jgi:hypothetical protein
VRDQASLRDAVRVSLANPSAASSARRDAAGQVFYKPGSATARAIGLVYELLELEMRPAAASEKTVLSGLENTVSR